MTSPLPPPPDPILPVPQSVQITVLSAPKGQNCNSACATQGFFCDGPPPSPLSAFLHLSFFEKNPKKSFSRILVNKFFCAETRLHDINNCEWLQKYFMCKQPSQCDENEGEDQPGIPRFGVRADGVAAYDDSTGLCLVKRRKSYNCGASHPKTQRLCPCT